MALLSRNELIGLPVFTASGASLGTVNDFFIETDSLFVFCLVVRTHQWPLFKKEELRIARNQLVSITKKAVIVLDEVVGAPEDMARFQKAHPYPPTATRIMD